LGGSYAIESLTDDIEKKSFAYIEEIEKRGGVVRCIEEGYQQSEIQNESYQYQKALEKKEKFQVGMNIFQEKETEKYKIHKVSEQSQKNQREALKKMKATRNNKAVHENLVLLEKAAKEAQNLMPPILQAVKSYATVGEISDVLRTVFGEYKPNF